PALQHPVNVSILAGPADVVHDLRAPVLDDRLADLGGKGVQHLIPARALPLPAATRADPFEGIEDAVRIVDLIDGRGNLRAVLPVRTRMIRVALKLADLAGVLVDEGHQPARGLAVEA